jgi:hypothetical protein
VRLQDGRVIADERRGSRAWDRALGVEAAREAHVPRVWAQLGGLLERARGR